MKNVCKCWTTTSGKLGVPPVRLQQLFFATRKLVTLVSMQNSLIEEISVNLAKISFPSVSQHDKSCVISGCVEFEVFFFKKAFLQQYKKKRQTATKCTIRECYIQKRCSWQGLGVMIFLERSLRGGVNRGNFLHNCINIFLFLRTTCEEPNILSYFPRTTAKISPIIPTYI